MRNVSERGAKEAPRHGMRDVALLLRGWHRLRYYGLALLFVAAAAILRWALPDVLGPTPFLAFYLAWVAAAAFGGLGPGLLATAASWLCVDLLFDPAGNLINFADPATIARLAVLLAGGLTVSLVAEKMRRGRIHERRQAREVALAKQEWERTFDAVPDLVAIIDPQHRILRANRAMAEHLGTTPAGCIGLTCYRCVHNLDEPPAYCPHAQTLADGREHVAEVYEERLGGYFLISCTPLVDQQGQMIASVHVARDITERKQAEERLRHSEEDLKRAQAVAQTGSWQLNVRRNELLWSDETYRIFGIPTGTPMTYETFLAAVHPEDREYVDRKWTEALRGEPYDIEHRVLVGGELKWVREKAELEFDEKERLLGGFGTVQDVTARKRDEEALRGANERLQQQAEELQTQAEELQAQAEELTTANEELRDSEQALRESEERFRAAYEQAAIGIEMLDLQGHLLQGNGKLSRILGYSEEELRQRTSAQITHPDDLQGELPLLHRLLAGEVPSYSIEKRYIHKDGHPVWVRLTSSLARTSSPYRISIIEDITDHRQAEEALRQSERRFRSTFENAAIGIAHVALEGRIQEVNGRFCEIAGYSCEDVLGRTCEEITFADDWKAEKDQIQRLLDGAVAHYSIEKRYLRRDGSPVWVNLTRSIQRDDEGRAEYFIVLVEDISVRKRVEEALRELTATLENKVAQRTTELEHRARQLQKLTLEVSEAEDRERRHLAEILHDDLQQVLAAAKFHLSLLSNRIKRDPSQHAVAVQIDRMLKDAIDKSRSLSHELSPAVLHHSDFAGTLGWLANQVQAKHGLVVHVGAFGEIKLQSDALKGLLYKAAQEMLFNVVKHARANEARIRVRRLGRCIGLSVSDRGRGFDLQELKETHGFGLLSIRERVELLGGHMKIKSAKDKGSTFFIVVPDAELHEADVEVEPKPNGRARPEKLPQGEEKRRLRVLLADDHEIVREGLTSLLREESGIEVVGAAANGREAVDLASQLRPDVVIMDVALPLMSGDEATRQIKRHLPDIRIVALSMYEEPEVVERMRLAGAESYVLKTAPSEELLAAIRGEEPGR